MKKAELISRVQEDVGGELTRKKVGEVVDSLFEEIANAIKKDTRYSHPGFGTFTVKNRAARTGRNPRTGEAIEIAASSTVAFKPAPELKRTLNP